MRYGHALQKYGILERLQSIVRLELLEQEVVEYVYCNMSALSIFITGDETEDCVVLTNKRLIRIQDSRVILEILLKDMKKVEHIRKGRFRWDQIRCTLNSKKKKKIGIWSEAAASFFCSIIREDTMTPAEEDWLEKLTSGSATFYQNIREYLMQQTNWCLFADVSGPQSEHSFESEEDLKSTWFFTLLFRYLHSNVQSILYLCYFLNLVLTPCLLSGIVPVAICLIGSTAWPRPNRSFFLFCGLYTITVIWIKVLFQLETFCVSEVDFSYSLQPNPDCPAINEPFESSLSRQTQSDYLFGLYKVESVFNNMFLIILNGLERCN